MMQKECQLESIIQLFVWLVPVLLLPLTRPSKSQGSFGARKVKGNIIYFTTFVNILEVTNSKPRLDIQINHANIEERCTNLNKTILVFECNRNPGMVINIQLYSDET